MTIILAVVSGDGMIKAVYSCVLLKVVSEGLRASRRGCSTVAASQSLGRAGCVPYLHGVCLGSCPQSLLLGAAGTQRPLGLVTAPWLLPPLAPSLLLAPMPPHYHELFLTDSLPISHLEVLKEFVQFPRPGKRQEKNCSRGWLEKGIPRLSSPWPEGPEQVRSQSHSLGCNLWDRNNSVIH